MTAIDTQIIIKCLHEMLPDLQGIYLFGSFATGYATQESDVDIAVLCQNKIDYDFQLNITVKLSMLLGRDVDLIELRYVNTIFQEEILKTAKRISAFDRMTCEMYEDFIYSSAMDFREFRKPHVEEIIARGSVYG
ncbi:MAG: nucleotidyltransferase domain-containing protein [Gammaproteobacteria bacterium]|nr:nucleotidyltransferase domain-containing protein [Gammaproteobacteria bacterium]